MASQLSARKKPKHHHGSHKSWLCPTCNNMIFTVSESLLPHMAVCRGQDESIAWNTTPAGVANNKEVMKRTNSEMPTMTQRNHSTPGYTHPDGINTMPAQRQNTSIANMMGPVNIGKSTIHQFADIDFASDL